jgi:hypothetical protein
LFLLVFFLQNFIDGSVIFCLVRNGFDSMRVLSRIRYLNGGKLLVLITINGIQLMLEKVV